MKARLGLDFLRLVMGVFLFNDLYQEKSHILMVFMMIQISETSLSTEEDEE